jgi:hypothetical protein
MVMTQLEELNILENKIGDEGRKTSKKFWTKASEEVHAILSKKYMGAMTEAKEKEETTRREY